MEYLGKKIIFELPKQIKDNSSERGEFIDFFFSKLEKDYFAFSKRKLTKKLVAIKISHIPTKDLYYFKSICSDAERRGYPFSKFFWGNIKVRRNNWLN